MKLQCIFEIHFDWHKSEKTEIIVSVNYKRQLKSFFEKRRAFMADTFRFFFLQKMSDVDKSDLL